MDWRGIIPIQSFYCEQTCVVEENSAEKCNRFIHSVYICKMIDMTRTSRTTDFNQSVKIVGWFFYKDC